MICKWIAKVRRSRRWFHSLTLRWSSDPEKQITLIDSYLSRMHSSTEKDREFSTRIIRYRETLSHSVEQARLNGQHRQRLLNQTTTLNTLSSNPAIKREQPSITQQKSNGTTLIQLPLAKQDELLNAVLKKLRHVNLQDLQVCSIDLVLVLLFIRGMSHLGPRHPSDGTDVWTEITNTKTRHANRCSSHW